MLILKFVAWAALIIVIFGGVGYIYTLFQPRPEPPSEEPDHDRPERGPA